jgi:hypothetical protein
MSPTETVRPPWYRRAQVKDAYDDDTWPARPARAVARARARAVARAHAVARARAVARAVTPTRARPGSALSWGSPSDHSGDCFPLRRSTAPPKRPGLGAAAAGPSERARERRRHATVIRARERT